MIEKTQRLTMRTTFLIALALIFSLCMIACKEDPAAKIPALEAAFQASNSDAAADSLVQAYQAAAAAHPDKAADNLHYLSAAAIILFDRNKDALGAVRLANEAIEKYGEGQNLTEPIGVLAQVWCAYQYKSTPDLSKRPDDIDLTRENLEQNLPWIDSSLMRIDKQIATASGADLKVVAEPFIRISEAYAALVEKSDVDKHVDLLRRAAGLAKSIGDPNKALRLYYSIAEKLPEHKRAPEALFMMGFIYDDDLKNFDKAKEYYELFLERYPENTELKSTVESSLKNLGIPPEELIKQFQQNNPPPTQ